MVIYVYKYDIIHQNFEQSNRNGNVLSKLERKNANFKDTSAK